MACCGVPQAGLEELCAETDLLPEEVARAFIAGDFHSYDFGTL